MDTDRQMNALATLRCSSQSNWYRRMTAGRMTELSPRGWLSAAALCVGSGSVRLQWLWPAACFSVTSVDHTRLRGQRGPQHKCGFATSFFVPPSSPDGCSSVSSVLLTFAEWTLILESAWYQLGAWAAEGRGVKLISSPSHPASYQQLQFWRRHYF